MQAPGVGAEEATTVLFGTLLTRMVAEQAGSSGNLRRSELAQALSHAASMAGREEFQGHTGVSREVKELAISIGTSIAAKAVGAMCSRRRRLQAEGEEDAHAEPEDDTLSGEEPPEPEIKNMSPNTGEEGKGSHPSPKIGEGFVTPRAKPERHNLTTSPIKNERSETSEHSLGRMMDMIMNTGQRRDRPEHFLKNPEGNNRRDENCSN